MDREGVTEAGRRYAVIEHGEVGRVKDGVTSPAKAAAATSIG